MTNSNKIQEYIDTLENDKLMIETHFANIERILKDIFLKFIHMKK